MPIDALAARVVAGEPRAIARALSLVEDEAPAAPALLGRLHPHTGRAFVIGVTGAPGVGKSTLVDRLIAGFRQREYTVGVIAVDPTSPFSGGALLGDRIRMAAHVHDAGVFIRSTATRGQMGGLAATTADLALVLDAAGKDIVLVETVGVGQDEIEVARAADLTIVVLVPGTGDDVQASKAGIMEIADIFVVNKADYEGADRLVHAVGANLSLQTFAPGGWQPPVLKTDASTGAGVGELSDAIERFRARAGAGQTDRRRANHTRRLRDLLARRVLAHVEARLPPGAIERMVDDVVERRRDLHAAAAALVNQVLPAPPDPASSAHS